MVHILHLIVCYRYEVINTRLLLEEFVSKIDNKDANQAYSGFVQHQHDCGECVFLGNITTSRVYDLYFHSEGSETVIARWGSNGEDYISGIPFADRVPELAIALVRAQRLGLL